MSPIITLPVVFPMFGRMKNELHVRNSNILIFIPPPPSQIIMTAASQLGQF